MRVFSEKCIVLKIKKHILSMIIFQYELHYVNRIYVDKTVYKYIKMMVDTNYNSFMTHIIQCNEYDKDKEYEKRTKSVKKKIKDTSAHTNDNAFHVKLSLLDRSSPSQFLCTEPAGAIMKEEDSDIKKINDAAIEEKIAEKKVEERTHTKEETSDKECEIETKKSRVAYEKLNKYVNKDKLKFNVLEQPKIEDFESKINEKSMLVAKCVLNTPDNIQPKKNKKGELTKSRREYYDPENPDYKGKKIEYIELDKRWRDKENEWLYCLVYNKHIVKIGMTISSLKERCISYSCGTIRAMKKGSCSTTNFIITECNFIALKNNISVEIFGIPCPLLKKTITRFGITKECNLSCVRDHETMLMEKFKKEYLHKPVLCVQEGK